jgi:hypothetical protein
MFGELLFADRGNEVKLYGRGFMSIKLYIAPLAQLPRPTSEIIYGSAQMPSKGKSKRDMKVGYYIFM